MSHLAPPGKSGFLGRDEMGHSKTTVGLTRARGSTIIAGPPDPYGLLGMVQTVYAYYFVIHSSPAEVLRMRELATQVRKRQTG